MTHRISMAMAALLCGCVLSCSDDDQPEKKSPGVAEQAACDSLVPSYCAFPFPNDYYTVPDEGSPTGLRVDLKEGFFPVSKDGGKTLPDPWNIADGFSSGTAIMAQFPGATEQGVPTPLSIPSSLEASSPTVIIDAETGERIPHWAELDRSGTDPEQRAFELRPAVRLKDGTRYIVAIRNLTDASGNVLPPSPAFQALRDGSALDSDPTVEARRAHFEDIFQRLDTAGVAKDDLLLAWDFTTASRENNTGWMVHMRDEALEAIGATPSYTITSAETDWDPNVGHRIYGTMTVPLYLDQPDPGADLLFGSDGMPEPNPDQPSYEVEWELLIPASASAQNPAPLLQYGHGLLGEKEQIESDHFRTFINQYNYALFGVDLIGMAAADEDWIAAVLVSGKIHDLSGMFDRLHQGTLNNLLAMRVLSAAVAQDPTYGELIDGDTRYYHGISQGGIFGGVYMGLTTDVQRGALGVMGMPYTLLLNRSVDFEKFFAILQLAYADARDQQLILGLIQMMWDRVEPNGYAPYIRSDTLPGTPSHELLMRAAVGDHQVTTLGAHVMARSVGAVHVESGVRDVWGLETAASVDGGTGYIEYSFGLPDEPLCNIPNDVCEDPHGKLRKLDSARQQLDTFLRTGRIENFCDQGSCVYSDMSGCAAGETTPSCEL